jgi:hypothetical protein
LSWKTKVFYCVLKEIDSAIVHFHPNWIYSYTFSFTRILSCALLCVKISSEEETNFISNKQETEMNGELTHLIIIIPSFYIKSGNCYFFHRKKTVASNKLIKRKIIKANVHAVFYFWKLIIGTSLQKSLIIPPFLLHYVIVNRSKGIIFVLIFKMQISLKKNI